jgi:exonuclease SbcC
LARLDAELTKRQELATERDRTRHELKAKQRIYQFVQDARHIYDQAGPRITKLFTKKISDEADRIFRELLNRQSVALEWTEDYEIRMQEGGNWRSFKSLSGGEQMCAALAVRLALIRILADIDIVFLDEPTTNMDENRRKQLAQAVANVTNFRQLFVISHDDTFENVADNVILVERESAN